MDPAPSRGTACPFWKLLPSFRRSSPHRWGRSLLFPEVVALGVTVTVLSAGGCTSISSTTGPPALRPPPIAATPAAARPRPSAPVDTLSAEEARDLAAIEAARFQGPVGPSNNDLNEDLVRFLGEESDALLSERIDYDIPIVWNERVEYFIDYFQNRVRKSFAKWLARAPQYVPYLRERFAQAGLPEDLLYISLIESGFSPQATSRANAVGYWQFIAGTGRRYGLRIDRWVDERRDFEKSTEAAIAYLQDLHGMFGSWFLAAAAYNSGEGKIQRAIERYGSENLWELAEFSYLREETKSYVPKLIAAILIAKEPDKYGFPDVAELEPVEVDVVSVPTQTDLAVLAVAAGTEVETLRALNPLLRSYATPPGVADFKLKVPRGAGDAFRQRFARIPPEKRLVTLFHVVRRGENPTGIAMRYGVSPRDLMLENRIKSPRSLRVGQKLRIPRPARGWEVSPVLEVASADQARSVPATSVALPPTPGAAAVGGSDSASAPPSAPEAQPGEPAAARSEGRGGAAAKRRPAATVRYLVKPGDTLYRIARDHGVTVSEMERWNPTASSRIMPGMSLVIHPAVEHAAPSAAAGPARPGGAPGAPAKAGQMGGDGGHDRAGRVTVRVRWGDTIWSIARRNGVTPEELRRWNGLSGDVIKAGQRLVLYPGATDSHAR